MEFLDQDLESYIGAHTSQESQLLQQINRETNIEVLRPRMLSGHVQGRFLSLVSKMLRPRNILEIGTYTGYSAICLSEGLTENGTLLTIDVNEELEDRVVNYFQRAGIDHKAKMLIGDALEIVPSLETTFDLVFIDADKSNYSNYLDLVFDKIPSGGVIIADNVLWSGKVIDKFRGKLDKDTEALLSFNKKVQDDNRFENVLLGIRDGLLMIRKK